jgi:hypothetical protein
MGTDAACSVLATWKASRKWVRSVELMQVYEPQALMINRRHPSMVGKHKVDLAELILLIEGAGGRVIHLKLRRQGRIEENLSAWAVKHAEKEPVGNETSTLAEG